VFGDAVEERLVEVGVFANVVADLQVVRIQMFQLAKRLLGDGSFDDISRMNGWVFHTDGIHLNSRGGAILVDVVQQFLDS
jgi:hypothetical protein